MLTGFPVKTGSNGLNSSSFEKQHLRRGAVLSYYAFFRSSAVFACFSSMDCLSSISFTCMNLRTKFYNPLQFGRDRRKVPILTTVCTVDFEMPNCAAAARTVARFSMMYWASSTARSSILPFNTQHSPLLLFQSYADGEGGMLKMRHYRGMTAVSMAATTQR